ncbi:MAG: DUF5666 domain-containing protein [bacterium]
MRKWNGSTLRFVPLALLLTTLVACGDDNGNGGDGGGPPPAANNVAFGRIDGFGSIFVNGIEFETSGASFSKDGTSSGIDESDLREGMMVTLRCSVNDDGVTGTASSVDYRDNLEGPISSIDLGASSFVVLGQTVVVDGSTLFDNGLNLAMLAVGDIVEVSGQLNADLNIQATFIEKKDETCATIEEIEVKGTVSNLNAEAQTFTLGLLTVNYSGADLEDLPQGGLADGLFVEVKSNACPVDSTLVATKVEAEDEFGEFGDDDDGREVEIQGYVMGPVVNNEFALGSQLVRITDQTQYEGLTADQIVPGVRLEVEGTIDAGVLVARKVQLED